MKLLPFDTETSDMIVWKERSEGKNQPHMVQVAAQLIDSETRQVIDSMDVIVKPDGWTIPQKVIDIHGITMEKALDVGIPEKEALEMYIELWKKCDLRIAHNINFDNRIIRIGLKRFYPDLISDEVWKDKSTYFCTFLKTKKIIGGKTGHTLKEAYFHFTGKKLEGAHNAMVDLKACIEIYFAIQDGVR